MLEEDMDAESTGDVFASAESNRTMGKVNLSN